MAQLKIPSVYFDIRVERFNKKQVPRNDQFLFILHLKKFQAHRRVPPTTGVVELRKKN